MRFPKVSVVIPVYNRAAVVGRAVTSVLAQTYQDLEVLVVDDGSNDADLVESVLADFKDPRIEFIRLPTNRGGAAARNAGAGRAVGELLAFLDSDDEWMPDKLATQVAQFCGAEEEGAGWLVSCRVNARTLNGDLQVWPRQLKCDGISVGDYLFMRGGFLQTSSFMMRRVDFLRFGFREHLLRHQDFDLVLRLEAAGFQIRMREEVLVILHWEDQHVRRRVSPAAETLEFFRDYCRYLSPRARANFLYEHLIKRVWSSGGRADALRYCRMEEFGFRSLVLRNKIDYLSWWLFGDSRLVVAIACCKKMLRGRRAVLS